MKNKEKYDLRDIYISITFDFKRDLYVMEIIQVCVAVLERYVVFKEHDNKFISLYNDWLEQEEKEEEQEDE